MPELPEVETMCRGIASIVGMQIDGIDQPPCDCRPCVIEPDIATLDQRLRGQTVAAIERRGKRVMLRLQNETRLVIEPRMSGLVLLADPPSVEHLRLRVRLSSDSRPSTDLLVWDRRGLGTIRLLTPQQYTTQVDQRLGPDALAIEADDLRSRLKTTTRPIKVALLDQTVVAGIGNLYAVEILFAAGIDPRTRCDRLSRPKWQRIGAAITEVLDEAIANEGSTLSDGTYRNALNDPGGYQNLHRVYDRKDEPCVRCPTGRVRRIVQAQRSTFFCDGCQKR
ncbi:bifunctional DNA-formamidopyrimidine glycosylase/DNA-(apurinic or apyrimidinic site) lyase [Neorhodopirellula pilleata]|uniref:Formamidopyrimidine-DNA glycosylase n=1 Tax=Neorhodopirellula pilleata TaxID=2714738 RepID=A0A5C6AX70_9BACT|nr:bifunctional DNA-formamidopyrimidine glycosylase/DNA-(apurinic or apyrimidinic site) lyase [Neorhodopirellula pilleata]TWU03632.1 Formamidopyrimidine-DNA glycosylase [Neorhodopirellula pilleata]